MIGLFNGLGVIHKEVKMTILNNGKQDLIFLIGGSITSIPTYIHIGSGSGVTNIAAGSLRAFEDAQIRSSPTYPAVNKVKITADWNSVEMSGLELTEFGLAKAATGSIYSRTSLPNINFDGSNELRIEETWEVF